MAWHLFRARSRRRSWQSSTPEPDWSSGHRADLPRLRARLDDAVRHRRLPVGGGPRLGATDAAGGPQPGASLRLARIGHPRPEPHAPRRVSGDGRPWLITSRVWWRAPRGPPRRSARACRRSSSRRDSASWTALRPTCLRQAMEALGPRSPWSRESRRERPVSNAPLTGERSAPRPAEQSAAPAVQTTIEKRMERVVQPEPPLLAPALPRGDSARPRFAVAGDAVAPGGARAPLPGPSKDAPSAPPVPVAKRSQEPMTAQEPPDDVQQRLRAIAEELLVRDGARLRRPVTRARIVRPSCSPISRPGRAVRATPEWRRRPSPFGRSRRRHLARRSCT